MTATADDVAFCYRLILGREPDPEGLRSHIEARLSVEAVVRSLLDSAEYRTKNQALKTVMLFGHEFVVRASQTMYVEDYEPYVFHHLMKFIAPGKRFLDVGANIGMFAVHAAVRGAEVIAIEARPSNNALILENARRSHVSIELHPLAVSDRHGYAVLDVSSENENAAIRRGEAGSIGDYVVATALIDELVGDQLIDVMKIDIEGHEYRAMLGARRMLASSRPVIVSEYHPDFQRSGSGVPGAVYFEYLQQFGYRMSMMLRSGELQPVATDADIDAVCYRLGHHIDLLLEPI